MKALVKRLVRDTRGTSAVEYGLICAMIVLAMLGALQGVSNENNGIWAKFTEKSREAFASVNPN